MKSIALVSGADANYYPLLREWIHSVRRFPESAGMDICIIDGGLSPEQREELKPLVAHIVAPDWPKGVPLHKVKGLDYLKPCVCRPFIPQMFAGYDTYLWMDSDTWVQDWSRVDMFLKAVAEKPDRIALTTTADRSYPRPIRVSWIGRWPYKIRSFYNTNIVRAFGHATAKKLRLQYVLSVGCFALKASAPHWAHWQRLVVEATIKGKIFPAEQLALGVSVYLEGCKAELLPVYAHWFCELKPMWDEARQLFVEPYMPHEPIGVLHLSGIDAMRADRKVVEPFQTRAGKTIDLNLRYPHFDGGKIHTASPKRRI